jgi:hypothetical protein
MSEQAWQTVVPHLFEGLVAYGALALLLNVFTRSRP